MGIHKCKGNSGRSDLLMVQNNNINVICCDSYLNNVKTWPVKTINFLFPFLYQNMSNQDVCMRLELWMLGSIFSPGHTSS